MVREESANKPAPSQPRRRKRTAMDELAGLSPTQKEQVARWLDAQLTAVEKAAKDIQAALNQGQDWPGAFNQLAYFRVKHGVLKQLAWNVRTSRGGPLGGQRRRTEGAQTPTEE